MMQRRTIFTMCCGCITSKCVSVSPCPGRPSVSQESTVGTVLRQHVLCVPENTCMRCLYLLTASVYVYMNGSLALDWGSGVYEQRRLISASGCFQSDGVATRIGSVESECWNRTRKPAVPQPLHLLSLVSQLALASFSVCLETLIRPRSAGLGQRSRPADASDTHPPSDISKGPWMWLCSWET